MKKDSGPYKKIKIYCYIIGLIVFLTAFLVSVFLLHNLEKNEKTTGKYMRSEEHTSELQSQR